MTALSANQLQDFQRDGFLVLPQFFGDSELGAVRDRMAEMVDEFDPDTVSTVFSTTEHLHAQDDYFLTSGDTVRFFFEEGALDDAGNLVVDKQVAINKVGHAMHDLDPVFDSFSRDPRIGKLVRSLGLIDPLLLQSMYIFKQPRIGGEVTWHCDHTFLWTEPQSTVGLWVALEDSTLDNGCLWAVPGGHVSQPPKGRFRREGSGTTMDVFDASPYDTASKVALPVEAGALIVLHSSLPHWSAPNTTDVSRHAYTLHVIDGAADYASDNWLQRPAASAAGPLRGFA